MVEQITRAEIFLPVATVIQQFNISLAEGDPVGKVTPEDVEGMKRVPPPFKCDIPINYMQNMLSTQHLI